MHWGAGTNIATESGRACTRRRLHTASGQRGERVVNPSFRVKTVPDFIAYAKANPGKITDGVALQRSSRRSSRCAASSATRLKNTARVKREIEFDRNERANSINKTSTQLWLTLDP
jgi:hypothetical protein